MHTGSFTSNAGKFREEMFEGRKHLVAPVVMLVEGVHNGFFYAKEELAKFPEAWNGIPVPIHHPSKNGSPISANDPKVVEKQSVGRVWNTQYVDGKLKGEVWIDVAKAQKISPQALSTIQKGEPLEVSTGLWNEGDGQSGEWNGEKFTQSVKNFRPDHLALLPGGVGACSWKDGCGIRANQRGGVMAGDEEEGTVLHTLRRLLGLATNRKTVSGDQSLRDRERAIVAAAQEKFGSNVYGYPIDLYDDWAVFAVSEKEGNGPEKMYKVEYSFNSDDQVEISDPVEVEQRVEYVALTQNKDCAGGGGKGKKAGKDEDEEDMDKMPKHMVQSAQKAKEAFLALEAERR